MATGAVGGFIFGGCVFFFVYCMRGALKLGSHVHLSSRRTLLWPEDVVLLRCVYSYYIFSLFLYSLL